MIRGAVARALEGGALRSRFADAAARFWEARAEVVRPVTLPAHAAVIGVGGATLGGSYKTPLTLALARALSPFATVSVVGHGYGARERAARVVWAADAVRCVGDDAAWLARDLASEGIPVVIGDRGAAIALAAREASAVIVDGLLQARPRPLTLSILAVDAGSPWGSDACPPAGDRRAPRAVLLAATDVVVAVRDVALPSNRAAPARREHAFDEVRPPVPVFQVGADATVVLPCGRPVAFDELRAARVGVVLAVARADRVLRSLSARGIWPVETRLFADHAFPSARGGRPHVDVWLTTPKCATKLNATYDGATVAEIRQSLALPEALVSLCREALAKAKTP